MENKLNIFLYGSFHFFVLMHHATVPGYIVSFIKTIKMRYILFLMLTLVACKKSDSDAVRPSGAYEGIFKRYNMEGSETAHVELVFGRNTFRGTSDRIAYPALGTGKFSAQEGSLNFENKSVWTAQFDWTLILNGTYLERREGDSLILSKSYGNGWVDVYKLKKK